MAYACSLFVITTNHTAETFAGSTALSELRQVLMYSKAAGKRPGSWQSLFKTNRISSVMLSPADNVS